MNYWLHNFKPTGNEAAYAEKENNMTNNKTLYEIKQGELTTYGFKLATNSQGQWVMEVKGSGEILTIDKDKATEILPYTVGINFSQGRVTYHYFDEGRKLSKDDVLVVLGVGENSKYQLAVVSGVDTKSKQATKELFFIKKLA